MHVEFVDIADPAEAPRVAETLAAARARGWEPPLAEANGELLFVPWFSNWTLYDTLEEWIAAHVRSPRGEGHEEDELDLRDYGTD